MQSQGPAAGTPDKQGVKHPWRSVVAGAPVTVACAAVFLAGRVIVSAAGPGPYHLAAAARSIPEHWWVLLTSAFWAGTFPAYVLGTMLLLVAGIVLERRMGSRRFAAAAFAGQLLGLALSMGFVTAAGGLMGDWTRQMSGHQFAGPTALVCAAAMAATATMDTLWRRRIRLVVFSLLLLLALYNGGFADLVRLTAATTGLIVGPVLAGRGLRTGRAVSTRHEGRVLVALLVAVSAIGPVVAGLAPHAAGPLAVLRFLFTNIQPVDPQTLQSLCSDPGQAKECASAQLQIRAGAGGTFMAVLPSFLLLLLADGLRRGRRFAWGAALLIQGALSVLAAITIAGVLQPAAPDTAAREGIGAMDAAVYGHPLALVLPLLLPVLLSIILLGARRLFTVRAPAGTYRRLGGTAAAAAGLLGTAYVGAGAALAPEFSPSPGMAELLADVPDRFLPLGYMLDLPPAFVPQSPGATILYEGVGILFWAITGALILKTFLRPAHNQHSNDENRARNILQSHVSSSLSWMTTWPGNTYWFSTTSQSFIAYRVIGGIALTLGPPVGPKSAQETTFHEFNRHCTENGWTPCYYSAPQDLSEHASAIGWGMVQIAQDTILDLEPLAFKGKKFQDIRTAINNAAKAGVHAEWTSYRTAPLSIQAQIQAISEEWVADKKIPEMGFTLGSLDELNDPEVRCLLAIDKNRTVHAVSSWLPVYHNGLIVGWTLDFIRRRNTAIRASIEFLIASAALSLKDEGCDFISLSGAPLARPPGTQVHNTGSPGPESVIDRLLNRLGALLEPAYGFRSLLAFKAKFQPRYMPLYLLYPDAAALPAIGNAITRAYLPSLGIGQGLSLARTLLGPAIARLPKMPAQRSTGQDQDSATHNP